MVGGGVGLLAVSATTTSSWFPDDEEEEQAVLTLAGVPRELDAQELSDVNVSARERPGTSLMEGGELERLARWRYW